jgi:hypothetical protein
MRLIKYTRHLLSYSVVICLQGPSMVLALSGPLQAAFKSVPDIFVAHPSYLLE